MAKINEEYLVDHKATPEAFTVVPKQEKPEAERKAGQLTDEQLEKYFTDGQLENVVLQPIREEISRQVDELAKKLLAEGKIKNLYEEYGFYERLTHIAKEFPDAVVMMLQQPYMPEAVQRLFAHEKLLNIMEQLVGPEVAGNCIWNLRCKIPSNEATTVPWHQDSSYFDERSYNALVPTAWIPLLDANEENGCLEVAKGAHRFGRMIKHTCCAGETWYLMFEPEVMEPALGVDLKNDVVKVPVRCGSVLLFSNVLPHRSLDNSSKQIRWSLDLRWQQAQPADFFYGLKAPILLRSRNQPGLKPDWETFNGINRHVAHNANAADDQGEKKLLPSPIITGPWMERWPIVHKNKHTNTFLQQHKDGVLTTTAAAP